VASRPATMCPLSLPSGSYIAGSFRLVASLQPHAHAGSSLADFSTLKMEAIRSSETSVQSTSQNTAFFIGTAVKASNLTYSSLQIFLCWSWFNHSYFVSFHHYTTCFSLTWIIVRCVCCYTVGTLIILKFFLYYLHKTNYFYYLYCFKIASTASTFSLMYHSLTSSYATKQFKSAIK
jgi:hypothetical protein